jgi:hypothetical protein
MGTGFKILGAIVSVVGSIAFSYSLLFNQDFRILYWDLVGRNIIYAAIGAVAAFGTLIAAGNLMWHKE